MSNPTVALACASHSPMLMEDQFTDPDTAKAVRRYYAELGDFARDFDPELVIQFSPDHFHGFHYDLMPSFCIGTKATACGDWNTSEGEMDVDADVALAVLGAARDADFDVAVSYDMTVDHGFTQMWEKLFGRADAYPCVPIFVNCIATPMPTFRRTRLLGEAIGRFAAACGKRVLFMASGGLSHDPVVLKIKDAPPEVHRRLVHGASFWRDLQPQREAAVRKAAGEAFRGEGAIIPLNPAWDREFLRMLRERDWAAIDRLTEGEVTATAGYGGTEVLAWVAAAAAMAAAAPYEVVQENYADIPGWIVGLSTLAARPREAVAA